MPLPVLLVSRHRDLGAHAVAETGGDVVVLESLDAFEPGGHGPVGLLLLDGDTVSADDALSAARRVAGPGWRVALLRRVEDGPWQVETLSVGLPETLDDALAFARDPLAHPGALLDLRGVLRDAGRLRHDVNNALAVGLAESDLLLMDLEDGATREGVETIRRHLLRIRDQILARAFLRALPG